MPKKSTKKIISPLLSRPPIVVVMGHVDHGKTSLLDAIRQTSVALKEAGGITQKIGAYQVEIETKEGRKKITFIDTPGHLAFDKMRARGAQITDLAVIVIDGKDGVMPQTIESIKHCQEAKVPFIIAVNKIDLPEVTEVNIEKIKKQLAKDCGVQVEGYGGDVVLVALSAKTKKGVNELLEMIVLLAQMQNIQGDPQGILEAVVIESNLDKFRGPIGSVIVKNGTLKIGDQIYAEDVKCKVKALVNDQGKNVAFAAPGDAVEILGFEKIPPIGAKITSLSPKALSRNQEATSLELKLPEIKKEKLLVILKADSLGSLEAIENSLPQDILIVQKGVGEINDSDVLFAKSTKSIIIGFNSRLTSSAKRLADNERILIRNYNIIYTLLEELADAASLIGLIAETEKILGKAKIIAQFPSGKNKIAGCKVLEGRMAKNDLVRIQREEEVLGQGKIITIKHGKEDLSKAEEGLECGIVIEPAIDFNLGDMLLSYRKL